MRIDVAVGEVPWERDLLAAIAASRDVQMGRRLVDVAVTKDSGDVLITCPSVRGFSENVLQQLVTQTRVIVLLDSIRPPWLDTSGLDIREVADVRFDELVAECALVDPTPRLQLVRAPGRGMITAFVGVSGGVGVTTLAWMYARQRPSALLIDCNIDQPALGLLVGNGARTSTLRAASRELTHSGTVNVREHAVLRSGSAAVLGLSMQGDDRDELAAPEIRRLLVAASEQFPEVVLDFGSLADHRWDSLLDHVDRLVVVTLATPLGLVRLCSHTDAWSQHSSAIVVNRLRESAAGSRHVATAMRNLVVSEIGQAPLLVSDHVHDCDRGWLAGQWGAMEQALGDLHFSSAA